MALDLTQTGPPRQSGAKVVLAYAAIYLLWGSTYLAIRFVVESLPPLLMMGFRFFTAGALLFSLLLLRGVGLPRFSLWLSAAAVGVPLVTITYALLARAQQTVPSGLASLINSTIPMWIVIFDWIRPRGIRPSRTAVAGIVLGISGVGLLANPPGQWSGSGVSVLGAAMVTGCSISWALGSILSRHVRQPVSKVQASGMMMMTGGALLVLVASLAGEAPDLEFGPDYLRAWLALAYLIAVSMIGHTSYLWLLSVSSASKVASYAFVNPVIALILGALLAGEPVSLWTALCSVMIISAVMIIVLGKSPHEDVKVTVKGRRASPHAVRNRTWTVRQGAEDYAGGCMCRSGDGLTGPRNGPVCGAHDQLTSRCDAADPCYGGQHGFRRV